MKISRLLAASALASVGFAVPQMALAQEAAAPEAPTTATTGEAQEVTVVGSRIRRNQFNGADPIQLIGREEATAAGFSSTSEILQSTAVTGGTDQINNTYGGYVVNGGPGVNTVSLRGLGTSRTLVMLDGRRVSPAGSRGAVGSADLNVLPNAMIERVEILNTGASSVYGSDAVAGVINVVTRSDLNGIEVEAQHNLNESGSGNTYRYSVVGGFKKDRFSFAASAEYYKRDALKLGEIDWAQCPIGGYGVEGGDWGAGDYIDPATGKPKCFSLDNGGVTVNTIGTPNITADANTALGLGVPAGYTGICNRWRPNAAAGGTLPGFECVGGGSINLDVRDTFDADMLNSDVVSGAEIITGYAKAAYESSILGDAEFYADVLVTRRNSEQIGHRQLSMDYTVNSPLLPAELQLDKVFLSPSGQLTYPSGIRAFTSYGNYRSWQKVDFFRLNGGVRGNLPFGWRYDFFIGKSWSDSTYNTESVLADRIAQSMQVTADGLSCIDPSNGCVAAPRLTADIIGGNAKTVAPDWINFITGTDTGITKYRERTINFTVDGALFKLPGGTAQAAFGIEQRESSIDDTPGIDSINGNLYNFSSASPTRGRDGVWEYYGEVELPVLSDQIVHNLTLNGSARYTDYRSYGGSWTYKFGGMLSPVRGLSFRGSYGTSYRAPALFEQFLGSTTGFLGQANDPCNNYNSSTSQLIQERCAAEGLPGNGAFQQVSSIAVYTKGGAEAGLKAETSDALTFGGVIEPRLGESFGKLSLAVDYFRVKIDNGVSLLSASTILSQCYNSPQRVTCDSGLITRTPYTGEGTGTLSVIASYVNIADAKSEGIDFTLRYARELLGGTLRVNAQATHYLDRYSRTLPTQEIVSTPGMLENPAWTGTGSVSFSKGGWRLNWGVDFIDAMDSNAYYEAQGYSPKEYNWKTPAYFTHNASVRYKMDKYELTLGVRNIFNTTPPSITADYTNFTAGNAPLYSGYDIYGRQLFVGLRAGF